MFASNYGVNVYKYLKSIARWIWPFANRLPILLTRCRMHKPHNSISCIAKSNSFCKQIKWNDPWGYISSPLTLTTIRFINRYCLSMKLFQIKWGWCKTMAYFCWNSLVVTFHASFLFVSPFCWLLFGIASYKCIKVQSIASTPTRSKCQNAHKANETIFRGNWQPFKIIGNWKPD